MGDAQQPEKAAIASRMPSRVFRSTKGLHDHECCMMFTKISTKASSHSTSACLVRAAARTKGHDLTMATPWSNGHHCCEGDKKAMW